MLKRQLKPTNPNTIIVDKVTGDQTKVPSFHEFIEKLNARFKATKTKFVSGVY